MSVLETPYPTLFSPAKIRNMELRNRIIMAPMDSSLPNADGTVSAELLAYHRRRAAGGVGMITVEYCVVDSPSGSFGHNAMAFDDDRYIEGHAELVKAIHAEGAKACVQLFHAGRQTSSIDTGGIQPFAASPIACPLYGEVPREMTRDDIDRVIQKFGEAARRAAQAGYDAVEIHGTHGYLLANFLSAYSNHRTDEFGGSLKNRQKFPMQIVKSVRENAGDMALIVRMTSEEFVDGGTTIEEAKDNALQFVLAGADALHVSTGCHERIDKNTDPAYTPQGWRVPLARQIREIVDVPVITVGVIREPSVAEAAVADGSADFVALGRALLADAEWPNKALAGKDKDIRPCTSCNWCGARAFGGMHIGCAEDPLTGRESEPPMVRSGNGEPVVVVGAGPGGISGALLLDQAGYKVTLFEKATTLAPALLASAAAPGKEKYHWYRDYLIRKLEASTVDVKLGKTATSEDVLALNPIFVLQSTGSADRPLEDIVGMDLPHVQSSYDVLSGKEGLGAGTVFIYGAGETGCEAAKYAAAKGQNVILATHSSDEFAVMRKGVFTYRTEYIKLLEDNPSIEIKTGCTLQKIEPGSVQVNHREEDQQWQVDTVVMATGRVPNDCMSAALAEKGLKVVTVGDALEVRRIGDSVRETYSAVRDFVREMNEQATAIEILAC